MTDVKKNILLVSIAFPPKLDPEALQVARYFKYMAEGDRAHLDVVTSSDTLWMPEDSRLQHYAEKARQIVKIPIFEPKYVAMVANKLFKPFFLLPDTRLTFHLRWKSAVKQLTHKPDVIYARAFPLSSVLMGYKIAAHLHVPLVIHLSDPWVDLSVFKYKGLALWFQKHWQSKVFEYAKYITVASPRMLSFYKRKYPQYQDKFVYAPNVYDPADIDNSKKDTAKEKFRIVYTGSLNGRRQPLALLKALEKLQQKNPDVAAKLEVHMVGAFDSNVQRQIATANLPFVLSHGQVKFAESQQWQRKADLLVLIDGAEEDPEKAVYFPSKILDYLVAQKPILSITPKDSATREILTNGIHKHFAHDETEQIAAYIQQLMDQPAGIDGAAASQGVDTTYSAAQNAQTLLNLLLQA